MRGFKLPTVFGETNGADEVKAHENEQDPQVNDKDKKPLPIGKDDDYDGFPLGIG